MCLFRLAGLESREYDHLELSCWPGDTLYPQKLALLRQQAAVVRLVEFASGLIPRFFSFLWLEERTTITLYGLLERAALSHAYVFFNLS
jgi:hypothetical protein